MATNITGSVTADKTTIINKSNCGRRDAEELSGSLYQPINPLSLQLRHCPYLDSRKDKTSIMDIDFVIRNYGNKRFLMIENKCFDSPVSFTELETLKALHGPLMASKDYQGTFLIQHELTNMYDGCTRISELKSDGFEEICTCGAGDGVTRFIQSVLKDPNPSAYKARLKAAYLKSKGL